MEPGSNPENRNYKQWQTRNNSKGQGRFRDTNLDNKIPPTAVKRGKHLALF